MMDQAADIAFFAVMAAVPPLLLTMMACLTPPMASHQDSTNSTASVYPSASLMCPATRTFLSSKRSDYTACITSMAVSSDPAPLPVVTPT